MRWDAIHFQIRNKTQAIGFILLRLAKKIIFGQISKLLTHCGFQKTKKWKYTVIITMIARSLKTLYSEFAQRFFRNSKEYEKLQGECL